MTFQHLETRRKRIFDRIERIETVQAGLGSGDWEVYVQLLEPPFEGEEVSIYLVSCDYDRVGHFSNGCVDRRLLELFSRASKQEPEQAGKKGQQVPHILK